MTLLQQAFVDMARGLAEGGFGQAVLSGLEATPGTGMQVNLASGIATSVTGYLCAVTGTSTASIATAPTGTLARNDLIVLRPTPTDLNMIPSPTNPASNVPLNSNQNCSIVVISGTPAATGTQVYPSALPNDVVVAGVKVPPSVTQITQSMVDYVARDRLGKNSLLGGLNPFDYIVSSTRKLATHKTLKDFCADATVVPGSRVLVCDSEAISSGYTINVRDLSIEFLPGVTLSKTNAFATVSGLSVAASGVHFIRGRFTGFNYTGDVSLAFLTGAECCVVDRMRFHFCNTAIEDSATLSGVATVGIHTEA